MFGFKRGSVAGSVDTMIGPGAEIKGQLRVRGTVFIDGKVEGDVQADEGIMMGASGQVKGDLRARTVVVGGRVAGDCLAEERLELLNTASVKGDLKSARMVIGEGAYFEGAVVMTQPPAEAGEAKPEAKQRKGA
jgi:cytoskeletal protein CcmA (bactofilin family)